MPFYCPNCNKIVEKEKNANSEKNKNFPFCSKRCRLIDLGAWLDEKYRIDHREQTSSTPQ